MYIIIIIFYSISLVILYSFTKIFNKKSFILFYLQTILFQINLSRFKFNYIFLLFVIFISDKTYPLDEYFTVDETAIGVYGKFLTGKESSALVCARIKPRNHNELRANTHSELSTVSVKRYNCYAIIYESVEGIKCFLYSPVL